MAVTSEGEDQLVTLDVRDGRIHAIFAVRNPDKLTHHGSGATR
jgi:RNA polymerase sigma-70 factor (ECF subfamily)